MTAVQPALHVRSGQGDYVVTFAKTAAEAVAEQAVDERNLYVIDATVRRAHHAVFSGISNARVCELEATEENKTLAGVGQIASFLQEAGASKSSRLVVVGGGIVQDVGAFAAKIYYRGVPYVFIPTTLLAMADSCIGAKCGLNHGRFKNQLGTFASPQAVTIATEFLATLPASDVRSGYGEMLKLVITSGEPAFADFEQRLQRGGFGTDAVAPLIRSCLETKRAIIEVDEYESGLRKTLNYGHTFGHAIETLTGHTVPHGLAVAVGLDLANSVARERDLLDQGTYSRIHALVAEHFSVEGPTRPEARALIDAMRRDKKASGDKVQLILLRRLGNLEIVPTTLDASLEGTVDRHLRANWS